MFAACSYDFLSDVVGRFLLGHKSLLMFSMTERLLLSAACILSNGPEKAPFFAGAAPFPWALGDFLGLWAHLGGSFLLPRCLYQTSRFDRDISVGLFGPSGVPWVALGPLMGLPRPSWSTFGRFLGYLWHQNVKKKPIVLNALQNDIFL